MPTPGEGKFETNRNDVKKKIRDGGWKVAFGREITYDDIAEAIITVGGSIGPLVNESVNQMEESVRDTITPEVKQEATQYAQRVTRNLIEGRNVGEQVHDIGRFNFKAGMAEFIGKNYVWIPNTSSSDGGDWQFVPPNVISYCPYVGFRFKTPPLPMGTNTPIYAITPDGDMHFYKHAGVESGSWSWPIQGNNIGHRWNYKHIFAGSNGAIYAVTDNGDMYFYKHAGFEDGSWNWPIQGNNIGHRWNYKHIFAGR